MIDTKEAVASIPVYEQFMGGKFVSNDRHTEFIDVFDPCSETLIGKAPAGTKQDADLAVKLAKKAQVEWAQLPPVSRAAFLKKMAAKIRENRVLLARTLSKEQAKALPLAQVEIDVTAEYYDYYAGMARSYEGEIIPSDRPGEQIYLYKCPIGVVVGICPWNFPFFVMARKIAPALLTGNAVIIKVSEETPMTCLEFAKSITDISLPAGVLSILSGTGNELGEALTSNKDVGMISLTGSVLAGEKVMTAAAKNITKVSLELGGKAPAIVCNDADLGIAVKSIVASRILYSGQICNCAERVYVESGIYDQFIAKLVEAMKNIKTGNALEDENIDMSAQINSTQLKKVHEMVERAVKQGGRLLTGGKKNENFSKGHYYEPTIIVDVKQDSEIIQREIFGPVLPVIKVSSFDEALQLANDSEYGLTSSLYTNNINNILRATKELNFGEVYVNRENFEAIQGFHAGWRKSGIGGADGRHGLEEYLQTKVVYMQQN